MYYLVQLAGHLCGPYCVIGALQLKQPGKKGKPYQRLF